MVNKIKIKSSEPIKYGPHDFQLGDYVYAPVSLNDPSQGNQLACIDSQEKEGCSIIFAQTGRTVYREYNDLYLVPITEDWLKENPQVFASINFVSQSDNGFRIAYQYKFFAKRFNGDYEILAYELHYEDEEEYQRLVGEALNYFTCLKESQGKVTVAQIARFCHGLKLVIGVAQTISIHDLQHFLRFCGCGELKVPESLLED